MKTHKAWTTHMAMLIKVVQNSSGPILECGAGPFSTPLLHWLCAEERRFLLTAEDKESYWRFAKQFSTRNHRTRFVKDFNDWDNVGNDRHWGVIFIDHHAGRRVKELIRLKDMADYIIVHDSSSNRYEYEKIFPEFKYQYDWTFCKPWTTVVSNKKKLTFLYDNKRVSKGKVGGGKSKKSSGIK